MYGNAHTTIMHAVSSDMLSELVASNREEVIKRCREKAQQRFSPALVPAAMDHGVPLFLQQLVDTLRLEQSGRGRQAAAPEAAPALTPIGRAAALHGAELLRLGYSIDQVVHEYGDICQSVTAIAVEQNAQISTDEFRTLNRCLDDAIADAVASFGRSRQTSINEEVRSVSGRLNAFADEHRRLMDIVLQAVAAIRTGNVGLAGAMGTLLSHALAELAALTELTVSEILSASAGDIPAP
jgi:hypothetical protein